MATDTIARGMAEGVVSQVSADKQAVSEDRNAVEAAKTEVLNVAESIPEDYSTLSANVSELKGDLGEETDNLNTKKVGRYYVTASGNIVAYDSKKYVGMTDKVECKPNTSYTVKFFGDLPDKNTIYVGWFADDVFIEKIPKYNVSNFATFTSPDNATKMYFYILLKTEVVTLPNISIVEGTIAPNLYKPHLCAVDYNARYSIEDINRGLKNHIYEYIGNYESKKISNSITALSIEEVEPLTEYSLYIYNKTNILGINVNSIDINGKATILERIEGVKNTRILIQTLSDTNTLAFYVYVSDDIVDGTASFEVSVLKTYNTPKQTSMLVLGDSYSATETRYLSYVKSQMHLKNFVNLSVASATLKDKYEDKATYPYDGRPAFGGTGNNNTIGNQIAKLERLMLGSDLDTGETKIYEDENDYPDIILVEGGKNDSIDDNDDYFSQMFDVKSAYAYNSSGKVTKTNITIPKELTDLKTTNFGGVMYYIYKKLHAIFPNAKIFFITPSGIHYSIADQTKYVATSEQIRKSAQILCTPTIDWDRNGRITYADNVVTGSGTQEEPYSYNSPSEYTSDSLHPNAKGGILLGECVCATLRLYNLL